MKIKSDKVKIRLGISSCLMGEKVRYDGTHKLESLILENLGKNVEFVSVCPEKECGWGIPRDPVRLEGEPGCPRIVTIKTGRDYTESLTAWARRRVLDLEQEKLSGFIFKSRSPSCGMQQVMVYSERRDAANKGTGIFAKIFMQHFPLIPAEDNDRLYDPAIRNIFIKRIFT